MHKICFPQLPSPSTDTAV